MKDRIALVVECVSYDGKDILFDFLDEKDFLSVKELCCNKNTEICFEASMIFLHNYQGRKMHAGEWMFVDKAYFLLFLEHRKSESSTSVILFEVESNEVIDELLSEKIKIHKTIKKEYIKKLASSWEGTPCALENMYGEIFVKVWDVGEGNCNIVESKEGITIFDFGASVFTKNSDAKLLLDKHSSLFNSGKTTSLIISHWHVDHYSLLCSVDDSFWKNVCCAFYPSEVYGYTAKRIASLIEDKCRYRVAIESPQKRGKKTGVYKLYDGSNYQLLIGEKTSNINESGLMLSIFGKKEAILLTADHSNYQVWEKQYNLLPSQIETVNVVIPHHGGLAGTTRVKNDIEPGKAIISVGKNNYRHPRQEVIDEYNKNGYDVCRTDWERKDIEVKLR